jgi:translation initiation factor 3 subunit A
VAPEFHGLFQLMEQKFAPLTFVQNVMPYVKKLQASESLSKYASVFLQGCIIKLVSQLSTVYSSVKIDFVRKLVAPAGLNFYQVESFLMRAVYKKQLEMRVDHVKGFVYFGTLQAATSAMETQVARFGAAMQRISAKIASQSTTAAKASSEQRAAYLKRVAAAADDVHAQALERKVVIERRKEDLEERKQVRIELETARRMEEEKLRQENELKRIVEEEATREKERRSKVFDVQRAEQIKAMLEQSGKTVDLKTIQDADATSREKMLADARDKFQKDKDTEAQKKIDVAKRLDHITRALRLEGASKVVAMYESQVAVDKELYDSKMAEDEMRDREKHALAVKEKERMSRMQAFRAAFEADFLATQKTAFDKHVAAQKAAVERDYYKKKLADARARKQAHDARVRAEEDAEIARQAQIEEDRLLAEREAVLREQRAEMEAMERERAALEEEKRTRMKREAEEMRARRDAEEARQREAATSDNASSWVKASSSKSSAFGGDRDEPRRFGFGSDRGGDATRQRSGFGGDRDQPRRGGFGGDRAGFGGDRAGDRDSERPRFGGDSRFAGKFSSGGGRDDAPREDARFAKFGSGGGGSRDRESGDRPRETRDMSRW